MVLDGCGKRMRRFPSTAGSFGHAQRPVVNLFARPSPDGLIKVNNAYGPAGDGLTSANFTRV
jgi:hypothetical protein